MAEYLDKKDVLSYVTRLYEPTFGWIDVVYLDCINHIHAADVAPIAHAKWKPLDPINSAYYECSNCGFVWEYSTKKMPFCPTCGARMDGDGNG